MISSIDIILTNIEENPELISSHLSLLLSHLLLLTNPQYRNHSDWRVYFRALRVLQSHDYNISVYGGIHGQDPQTGIP